MGWSQSPRLGGLRIDTTRHSVAILHTRTVLQYGTDADCLWPLLSTNHEHLVHSSIGQHELIVAPVNSCSAGGHSPTFNFRCFSYFPRDSVKEIIHRLSTYTRTSMSLSEGTLYSVRGINPSTLGETKDRRLKPERVTFKPLNEHQIKPKSRSARINEHKTRWITNGRSLYVWSQFFYWVCQHFHLEMRQPFRLSRNRNQQTMQIRTQNRSPLRFCQTPNSTCLLYTSPSPRD